MAWQPSSAMAGNGGMAAGSDGASAHMGHQQGTEYTLQGVMRFLQTEWHRHERDRNAWEIERAEMKSRIGRLEGDARTSKRMHETLGKHVKMLEAALKKEREKVKSLSAGEAVDVTKDSKELAKENLKALPKQRSAPNIAQIDPNRNVENSSNPDVRQDSEREKSRMYLGKCSQEVAYHIIPGSHPPPELLDQQEMSDHGYQNHQMQRPSLEDAYVQHQYQHQQKQKIQHQQQQQQQNHVNMVREPSIHQPLASSYSENLNAGRPQSNQSQQEQLEGHPFDQQRPHPIPMDRRNDPFDHPPVTDEEVESITHTFDSYGKQVPASVSPQPTVPREPLSDDADGWNFDEPPVNVTSPSSGAHHRPDTDVFPKANFVPPKSPPRGGPGSHRRKSSGRRHSEGTTDSRELGTLSGLMADALNFKVRFALRGHLDVVRSVIFTGGGSPSEPEICTCGDDGTIKRWIIPASYGSFGPHSSSPNNDLDITSYFTHRGHSGPVTCLAACPPAPNFSSGGRALGDGWVFSGGQDGSVKVWERGRVDPKASLDTHTDSVWALCVLPGTAGSILGDQCSHSGGPDRIILASGGSDGRVLIWAVSAPPQLASPQAGNRRVGGSRRANSISSGSNFPSSPQPSTASATPFHYTLIHHIIRSNSPSPTSISPLSLAGVNFVVSYADASIIIYDTRSGEEIVGMASLETYDGTRATGVNSVVASTVGFDGTVNLDPNRALAEEETIVHGATGTSGGVEGVVISGYEDRYIRFFDANSGQCTYTMLAHPAAISSLSLSPDGRELVSAGHDASLRFWSLEKRNCAQEITSHRLLRGEGVCSVVWSQDGRWVVSGGGDGVVKVFAR
ncbi:WD domain-containing protein [Blastomyces dermatitidis ER-3]|uniref:WD domain-containing protein n=2 Tax=Ajellomyces dermatitidis TaxID=5039 RepID=F2TM85_AJEDA|nr:WD domain-containing protein [Blastomyces dermatitidis ER-3]EEQ84559.2 WD domain-containing protein [Blastomyces dermatitidis ER-3]EGE84348.1 WD domain-containing protein [Blastomyces dermatitidis ATCC 18188]